jgi:hypothetical protein
MILTAQTLNQGTMLSGENLTLPDDEKQKSQKIKKNSPEFNKILQWIY